MAAEKIDHKEWMELYDQVGNAALAWILKARALFSSADLLWDHYKAMPRKKKPNELEAAYIFDMSNIVRMLRGMGMECLLKAIWLRQGNELMKDGTMIRRSLNTKAHDLYAMAERVCVPGAITLSEDEGHVLVRLAFGIETGRYPTTTHVGKTPSMPSKKTVYLHRWDAEDEIVFQGLVRKLMDRLGEDA